LVAGSLSINLHFALAQSASSTQTAKTADGYMELRQTVERRFQADLSFNMSFLGQLDSTAQKMGGLGGDTLNEFVGAANNLMSLNEQDLKKFTDSVDKLFNELSKATGGGDAFTGAKELLKNSVTDYIHLVKNEMDKMSAPPAAGSVSSDGAPASLPDGAPGPQGTTGIDFSKLYNEVTKNFDKTFADFLKEMAPDAGKLINDNIQSLMDELKKIREKNDALKQEPALPPVLASDTKSAA